MSSDAVERPDGAAQLQAAVTHLPASERDVVSLACSGLTYRQVAERLGVADGVVRTAARRALTRLAHATASDATT